MRRGCSDSDDGEHRCGEARFRTMARKTTLDRCHAFGEITSTARQSLVRRGRTDSERARDFVDGTLLVVVQYQRLTIDVGHATKRRGDDALGLRLAQLLVWRRRVHQLACLADDLAPAAFACVAG